MGVTIDSGSSKRTRDKAVGETTEGGGVPGNGMEAVGRKEEGGVGGQGEGGSVRCVGVGIEEGREAAAGGSGALEEGIVGGEDVVEGGVDDGYEVGVGGR